MTRKRKGVIRMPVRYTRERVNTEVTNLRARAARVLPLPSSVRSRWLPAPLPVPLTPPTQR